MYSPRMCGGQPSLLSHSTDAVRFSPHARGPTLPDCNIPQQNAILPACAGVNPRSWRRLTARKNSPRMRGGQPISFRISRSGCRFSPHARGSTQCFNDAWFIAIILPACAGVNPSASNQGHCGRNFPRMREGQPAEQSAQF